MQKPTSQLHRAASITTRPATDRGLRRPRGFATSRQIRPASPALRKTSRTGRKPELGKFALWRWFARNTTVRRFLPQTARYSPAALQRMLQAHGAVFVKPSAGSRGRGVIKVWQAEGRYWVHHTVQQPRSFRRWPDLVRWLARVQGGRLHIVQQAVDVVRLHGRPVDFRVLVQRDQPGGPWLYTGTVAKVAGAGSVVTNIALSRGRVCDPQWVLQQGLGWSRKRAQQCLQRMVRLAMTAARHFDGYQLYRELGFDMAVDRQGRVWLLEENTAPSHALMKKLRSQPELARRMELRWRHYQRALRRNSLKKG
ncbi:MAG: YheC/YheD family protein [Alicyclobacillus sp.]|nr:YheC/YheD family protein [Alicyclobacillus sp.]